MVRWHEQGLKDLVCENEVDEGAKNDPRDDQAILAGEKEQHTSQACLIECPRPVHVEAAF